MFKDIVLKIEAPCEGSNYLCATTSAHSATDFGKEIEPVTAGAVTFSTWELETKEGGGVGPIRFLNFNNSVPADEWG